MVVHEGDGVGRAGLHQCSFQDGAQVVGAAGKPGLLKVEVQRHIEDGHPAAHIIDIPEQSGQIVGPIFSDHEQLTAGVFFQGIVPLREEPGCDVLDGIQAKTIDTGGFQVPRSPAGNIRPHLRILEINIAPHQISIVAKFKRDIVVEAFTLQQVDRVTLPGIEIVIINSIEMLPGPGK